MGGRGGSSHAAGGTARPVDTSVLAGFTTTKEVSRWMKKQKWFTPRAPVDLEGIAVDAAKSIAMAYKRVFDAYPQVIGKFHGVVALDIGFGTYAQCYLTTGRIEVNKDIYRDVSTVAQFYDDDIHPERDPSRRGDPPHHPPNTTWEAVVTHEIGHAINGYLDDALVAYNRQQILNNGFQNAQTLSLKYRETWQKEIYASHRLRPTKTNVGKHNSGYAASAPVEWFAESFAEGMDAANPRWAAKMFMEKLNELMKKVR